MGQIKNLQIEICDALNAHAATLCDVPASCFPAIQETFNKLMIVIVRTGTIPDVDRYDVLQDMTIKYKRSAAMRRKIRTLQRHNWRLTSFDMFNDADHSDRLSFHRIEGMSDQDVRTFLGY